MVTGHFVLSVPVQFEPDPAYELVPAQFPVQLKKGRQCGLCGMKFDYDKTYGYVCGQINCPVGWSTS